MFVVAAEDIAGSSNAEDLARRLTLVDETGALRLDQFAIIEFDTPAGIASPYNRSAPGLMLGGSTGRRRAGIYHPEASAQ